jgi:8-oxo-dGTP diphosphatase
MSASGGKEVRAAGGVVLREGADGPEVAVVHRPRHDDWSLPKGKLDPGESFAAAALREVEEETGLRCELGSELPAARYRDARGRPKLVRYWLMRSTGGAFTANDEVDVLEWLPFDAAAERLDYEHDRRLLAAAASAGG